MSSLIYLNDTSFKDLLFSTYSKGLKSNIDKLSTPIFNYLTPYEINTELRLCHFLGQVGHETGELRYREEIATGANYEFRKSLGNVRAGDGRKFKGRGIIQLTGRYNYQLFADAYNLQIVMLKPEIIATEDDLCALTAFFYWKRNRLNSIADANNIKLLTRRINGGYNGLNDRIRLYNNAKKSLDIIKGKVLQTALNKHFNYKLAVDGVIGPITNNALVDFNRQKKLKTNTLTDSVWSALLS